MRALDRDDSRPPYVQLAADVESAISRGDYAPGDKLPTHAQLVDSYGVSVATVKKAFARLQAAGLIVSRRGEGAFVRARQSEPPTIDDVAALRRTVEALEARLERLEMRLDQGR